MTTGESNTLTEIRDLLKKLVIALVDEPAKVAKYKREILMETMRRQKFKF
jgi:hypothetical protein